MLQFIEDKGLVLLNDGSQTYFGNNTPSTLDLSICSPAVALIATWYTLNECLGSDHCSIIIECNIHASYRNTTYGVPKHIKQNRLNDCINEIVNDDQYS